MQVTFDLHDARQDPPKKSGRYMTMSIHPGGHQFWQQNVWSARHKKWNAHDYFDDTPSAFEVDYWAELPEVPNG